MCIIVPEIDPTSVGASEERTPGLIINEPERIDW